MQEQSSRTRDIILRRHDANLKKNVLVSPLSSRFPESSEENQPLLTGVSLLKEAPEAASNLQGSVGIVHRYSMGRLDQASTLQLYHQGFPASTNIGSPFKFTVRSNCLAADIDILTAPTEMQITSNALEKDSSHSPTGSVLQRRGPRESK